jgi:hypothetical protein
MILHIFLGGSSECLKLSRWKAIYLLGQINVQNLRLVELSAKAGAAANYKQHTYLYDGDRHATSLLISWAFAQQLVNLCLQLRNVTFDSRPHFVLINSEILMGEVRPLRDYFIPRYLCMTLPKHGRHGATSCVETRIIANMVLSNLLYTQRRFCQVD